MDLLTLLLVPIGFLAGVSDAVAGGGNLIVISILAITNLSALEAIATMQFISLVQNLTASVAFERKKLINWQQAVIYAPFAILGSMLGSSLAIIIDPSIFSIIVGSIMLVMLFVIPLIEKKKLNLIVLLSKLWRKSHHKRPLIAKNKTQIILLIITTLLIGFYGGFHGGAVGSLMLITFYFISKSDLLSIAATTKIVNVFIALTAAAIFLTKPGLVSWKHSIPLSIGTLFGSFVGVDWAKKYGYGYIRILMYLVIIGSAIKYLFLQK